MTRRTILNLSAQAEMFEIDALLEESDKEAKAARKSNAQSHAMFACANAILKQNMAIRKLLASMSYWYHEGDDK